MTPFSSSAFLNSKRLLPLCLGVFLLIFLPAIVFGVRDSDDLIFHAVWFESLSKAVNWFNPYPRWLPDQMGGLGSPAMMFYPPFASMFFVLLDALTLHLLPHTRVMALACVLMALASGFSFYSWARQLGGRGLATLAATCYAVAPYHVLVDYYMRGAYGEYAAYIWIPLIFCGIRLSVLSQKARWPLLIGLSVAALFFTHLLTAMIVGPVAAAYAVLVTVRTLPDRRARLLKLATVAAAGALGAGCAAMYFVPAISLMKFTNAAALFVLPISANFFYQAFLHSDRFLMKLFLLATLYLCLAVYLFVQSRLMQRTEATAVRLRGEAALWMAVIAATYLMMNGVGGVLFGANSPYHAIQFTWRLMGIAEFSLISLLVVVMVQTDGRRRILPVFLLGLLAVLPLQLKEMSYRFAGQSVSDNPIPAMAEFKILMNPPEYVPVNTIFPRNYAGMVARLAPYAARTASARLIGGQGDILEARRDGASFQLTTRSSTPLLIELTQFYFPGWQASLETGAALTVMPTGPDSLLSVQVPAGTHQIRVARTTTSQESLGRTISLMSLLLLFVSALALAYRARRV